MPARISISGDHTMQHIERKIPVFGETLNETLEAIGIKDDLSASIIKATLGNHFRSQIKVGVTGCPPEGGNYIDVFIHPPSLSNAYCVICRIITPAPLDPIKIYEDIMRLNQPSRFARYTERVTIIEALGDTIPDSKKPFSNWIMDSIPFSPHPDKLEDDHANLWLMLDEIKASVNRNGRGVKAEDIIDLMLCSLSYDPQNYGEEITAEVVDYLYNDTLPRLVEKGFLAQTGNDDDLPLFSLGANGLKILTDALPQTSVSDEAAALKEKLIKRKKDLTTLMRQAEHKLSALRRELSALQAKFDQTSADYADLCQENSEINVKIDKVNDAIRLAEKVATLLKEALS